MILRTFAGNYPSSSSTLRIYVACKISVLMTKNFTGSTTPYHCFITYRVHPVYRVHTVIYILRMQNSYCAHKVLDRFSQTLKDLHNLEFAYEMHDRAKNLEF